MPKAKSVDQITKTSQGTSVADCLGMLDRYCDSIEGKNAVHCGLLMANHAMREAAELLRLLAPGLPSAASGGYCAAIVTRERQYE